MTDLRRLFTATDPSLPIIVARWLLRMLGAPYCVAIALRNAAFDLGIRKSTRVGIPVISVGNLSVGGTGKTPVVAWLVRYLGKRSVRVGIVSRGYGQLGGGQNDEALELQLRFSDVPHVQNIDRVAAAQLAERELGVQLVVLDDGFQHRRLARDLDIVLIDATDPPSAHWMLPGGLLREPFASLSRADVVILTRVDQGLPDNEQRIRRRIAKAAPNATLITAKHSPGNLRIHPDQVAPLEAIRGTNVLAFCGIGNPDSFFALLENLGVQVVGQRCWPDHHAYTAADLSELAEWTHQFPEAPLMVCTMKDWVKIRLARIGQAQLAAVEIELEIVRGREEIESLLQPHVEKAVASIKNQD